MSFLFVLFGVKHPVVSYRLIGAFTNNITRIYNDQPNGIIRAYVIELKVFFAVQQDLEFLRS